MLNKNQKTKLKSICKVLFVKYKHATIDTIRGIVTFSNCDTPILRWFVPSWKVTITELLNYHIPKQLADFKYGNADFISVVQEDLVRCQLTKEDPILYFYNEIARIKYADIFKSLNVSPETVTFVAIPEEEDRMFDDMVQHYKRREREATSPFISQFIGQMNYEVAFYVSLIFITAYVLLTKLHI